MSHPAPPPPLPSCSHPTVASLIPFSPLCFTDSTHSGSAKLKVRGDPGWGGGGQGGWGIKGRGMEGEREVLPHCLWGQGAQRGPNLALPSSQGTWPSRKEPSPRELPAIPFISAVARKRKKWREAECFGSSTDDDAEHRDTRGRGQEEGTATAPGPGGTPRTGKENAVETGGTGQEPAADARSIVSGYSTLSTMERSLSSEVQSVAESRGEEADDERSELSHAETDTESRAGPGGAAAGLGGGDRASPGRPSFSSHRLIQCDTLARRKLGRARPGGDNTLPVGGLALPVTEGAGGGRVPPVRPSLREQLRQRLRGSADDTGVRLRRTPSPETRRRKSRWRRHTVLVLPGGITDLNCNEWKGSRGGLSVPTGPFRDPDSGLSSLESTKTRPVVPDPPGTGTPPGSPSPASPLRFPQCL